MTEWGAGVGSESKEGVRDGKDDPRGVVGCLKLRAPPWLCSRLTSNCLNALNNLLTTCTRSSHAVAGMWTVVQR